MENDQNQKVIYCPVCGTANLYGVNECDFCGAPLEGGSNTHNAQGGARQSGYGSQNYGNAQNTNGNNGGDFKEKVKSVAYDAGQKTRSFIDDKAYGVLSMLLAFFIPFVGLVMCIVGLCVSRSPEAKKYCKLGIILPLILYAAIVLIVVIFSVLIFRSAVY